MDENYPTKFLPGPGPAKKFHRDQDGTNGKNSSGPGSGPGPGPEKVILQISIVTASIRRQNCVVSMPLQSIVAAQVSSHRTSHVEG
jgi:hypothetical protein